MACSFKAGLRRRVAALLCALLGALGGCGGGGESEAGDDARVADGRVPLRYEVTGLQGSGGYVLVSVNSPTGVGETLRIPLTANGSFQTDTDPYVEHSAVPDGLYPSDATYRVFSQDSWPPSNPSQACTYSSGPPDTALSPPQPIGDVLKIDCTSRPLKYEVRGLQGSGAVVFLIFASPTAGVIDYDLELTGNGSFATDTDAQVGPRYIESVDPESGHHFPGFEDGRFPADTVVRALVATPPSEPAQACSLNGVYVAANTRVTIQKVTDTLVIDCGTQPLRYEVRGLQGSGGSVLLLLGSPILGVTEYNLQLTANGSFATDTDGQPGPFAPGGADPGTGAPLPGGGDGLLPADTQVRPLEVTQPAGPPQICTVNGVVPKLPLPAPRPLTDVLQIDCGSVYKTWRFDTDDTVRLPKPPGAGASGEADSVEVSRTFTYVHPELFGPAGPMGLFLGRADQDIFANLLDQGGPNAGMYSSADGRTYWIATEAGNGPRTHTTIETRWGVRKIGDDPKFTLTLSALQLAGQMAEGSWYSNRPELTAYASLEVRAHRVSTGPDGKDVVEARPFHHQYDSMELIGRQVAGGPKNWELFPLQYGVSGPPIFYDHFDKFVLTTSDGNGQTGNTGHAVLREPIGLSVNLQPLGRDERALIVVRSRVTTSNRFNNESLAVAYLRDPVRFDPGRTDESMAVTEISGLAMFSPPSLPADFEPQPDTTPAPVCAAADAPRAQLQFGAATYAVDEDDPLAHAVTVLRTGSTQGAVTARVRLLPGSAQPGVDYVARETTVSFADGDVAPRRLPLQLIDDQAVEGPETLTVVLDQPGGCADIGPRGTTTVTVLDDEQPPTAAFTIGGTVTGLVGSGLTIETLADTLPIATNGAFQFARSFPAGYIYRVRVTNQPQNPRQACTVANAEGTVTDANITNVLVTCTTLTEPGSLDAGFGSGGRVWTTALGLPVVQGTKIARQADGKLLVVSGGPSLLRLMPDGTPDAAFGTAGNGVVTVPAGRNDRYVLQSVAVQADGRILVAGAGQIGSSGRYDMAVARFLPNGTLDSSFAGGAGVARFDYALWNDAASQVLVQADGSILLAGSVSDAGGNGDPSDFAVLRLSASGQVDSTYGTNGWARMNVAGGYDVPRAAALTPEGGVVLAGRVAPSGGGNGDIGLVKFTAAGVPDSAFGGGNGVVRRLTPEHDEARDIVVMPDGRLVVVGFRATGSTTALWLARYLANGQLDTTFGSSGIATLATPLAGQALAVQSDGTVLVVGDTPSGDGGSTDFGIARFVATGQPDSTFGSGALLALDFFGGFDSPAALLLQPDEKLVIIGRANNGSSAGLGLARVVP